MANRRPQTQKPSENGAKEIPTIDVEVVDTNDSGNAELIAKIDGLKMALEKSQQKEKTLTQTIDYLQEQLDEQKTTIHSLQSVVEKANQIHYELEQAQQTALRLAESNQSLIEENKELHHENNLLRNPQKQSEPSGELALSQPEEDKAAGDLRRHQEILRQRQAARLSHPVFPNNPEPTQFENQDIGWVD